MSDTDYGRVGAAETGSREPRPQAVAGPSGFDPARLPEFNEVWDNRPAKPTWDREIEVCVVGRRCVYANNYRIAGGKPYVSEGLPSHGLKATVGDILGAFSPAEIRKALREYERERRYFADYHAAKAIAMETRQGRDAQQGSVEDDSAAIAQNPPSDPSERNA